MFLYLSCSMSSESGFVETYGILFFVGDYGLLTLTYCNFTALPPRPRITIHRVTEKKDTFFFCMHLV